MAYCRFTDDSDVYMLKMNANCFYCMACGIAKKTKGVYLSERYPTEREALAHLELHIVMGHKVPERALQRLKEEIKEQDDRNIADEYKGWFDEDIQENLRAKKSGFAVAMLQLEHDFNIGCVVRSANAFNADKVFYLGTQKRWNRRGAVGTYKYIDVECHKTLEEFLDATDDYTIVMLENNSNWTSSNIYKYVWPDNPLILIGEEGNGIPNPIIEAVWRRGGEMVYIPQSGTVRSLNAAVAGSIAMSEYTRSLL